MKEIVDFIFELGQLRRIRHEGLRLAGIDDPLSVAEHSLRAAQIAFILAKLEDYENPYEVSTLLVFHDMPECRTGDLHKVARRYTKIDEEGAVKEQTSNLPFGKDILKLWNINENKEGQAGKIAKDADYLEAAFTAKEYLEKGYTATEDWINNVSRALKTESAKKLLEEMKNAKSTDWWKGLKKLPN